MKMQDIAIESYATAQEKGWWDEGVPRSNDVLLLLMCSEVAEALDDYRNHKGVTEVWYESANKPCGIPSEAADVIIRIGDYAGKLGLDFDQFPDLGSDDVVLAPIPTRGHSTLGLLGEDTVWVNQFKGRIWHADAPTDFEVVMMTNTARIGYIYNEVLDPTGLAYAYWRICNDLVRFFDHHGYDLRVMIQQKMDFNKTRPIRHGNKKV
jgi:NTP pyrophosphatase (non-canonical NTP hydrolase)